MSLLVRRAAPTDAAGLAAVHVASWQNAYAGLIPQDFLDSLSVERRTETWSNILGEPSTPQAVTLVAELEGRVIGFASIGPCRDDDALPNTGELWGIYLHPSHWGGGHGHVLHQRALATLPSETTEVTLWVLDSNRRARRFYERHGWYPDGATKVDWRGDVRLDEVRYRLAMPARPAA